MLRRILASAVGLALVGGAAFWVMTMPKRLSDAEVAALPAGDAGRGERMFYAGGCTSCHARPGAEGEGLLELAGGHRLVTDFGTFVVPNISMHGADGIGQWSQADFANAMLRGVAPDGSHYYPAFPYASYTRMKPADVADLFAFMKTLPAIEGTAPEHELGFPFSMRRGIGLWKMLNMSPDPAVALSGAAPDVLAGQYLVEGPGHCGECHTPRDFSGGMVKAQWLAGAAAAEGDGIVPNITPGGGDVGGWSASDIASYLESGFTPEFDSAGGSMAAVVKNMARLSAEDRAAIAAYLKAIPAHENGYPARN